MNSQYRCETCDYRCDKKDGIKCPYNKEDVYYLLKEEMRFPRGSWLFTSVVGCASHSDFRNRKELSLLNSTDLLLLANDEWKRREERKRRHDVVPWVAGFITGYLTDKKLAREYDKLRRGEQK